MSESTAEVDVTSLVPRKRRRMGLVAIFMPSRAKRRVWDRVAQLELQISDLERRNADLDQENTELCEELTNLTTERDAALRLATDIKDQLNVALIAHQQNEFRLQTPITFEREPDLELPGYDGPRVSVYQDMPATAIVTDMTKAVNYTIQTTIGVPFAEFVNLGSMVFEGLDAADDDQPIELTPIVGLMPTAESHEVEDPIAISADEVPVTLTPVEAASQVTEPDWTGPTRVVISEVTASTPVRSLHDSPLANPTNVPGNQT